MRVHEDPDDLGYWFGPDDLSVPPAASTVACNSIIPVDERECITLAAYCASEGYDLAAERARVEGGYGSLD